MVTLLRNSGFTARNRRRLALQHRYFDLTKQHHDLLRTEPILRHALEQPEASFGALAPRGNAATRNIFDGANRIGAAEFKAGCGREPDEEL